MDIYYKKYIKYKTKYLELKKQIGGSCNEHDNPDHKNTKLYSNVIESLGINYYIIYHAFKHMDTIGLPCNYDGMEKAKAVIHAILNDASHKKEIDDWFRLKKEGKFFIPGQKIIQKLSGDNYMYIMLDYDVTMNMIRVFQIFRCDRLGNPIG